MVPGMAGAAGALSVVVQDIGGAVREAADPALFEPFRQDPPLLGRGVDVGGAEAPPHPGTVTEQERGPELAVDQVPGREPHLVMEAGGPLPPVDIRPFAAGVL